MHSSEVAGRQRRWLFSASVQADGDLLVGRDGPAALVDAEEDVEVDVDVGANEVLSLNCLADALVHAARVHDLD